MNSTIRKPWGHEYCAYRNAEVAIWVLEIRQGEATSLHAHPRKNTALIVLRGTVELSFIRGEPLRLVGLDKINVFRGRFHRTRALTNDVVLLEVETPDAKLDIVRLADDYGRVGEQIESETTQMKEECLMINSDGNDQVFAGCALRVITLGEEIGMFFTFVKRYALVGFDEQDVFVTLTGGLDHGLLPPGDAIDGESMGRLARAFNPLPGSTFLQIQRLP